MKLSKAKRYESYALFAESFELQGENNVTLLKLLGDQQAPVGDLFNFG
jgi:hypothetical protein